MVEQASAPGYRKTIFEWTPDLGLGAVGAHLTFVDLASSGDPLLHDLVMQVLAASSDPADVDLVSRHGDNAARKFLAAAASDFDFQIGWWQLARDTDDNPVGFHLPVIYRDSKRDNLEEGTIYYLGVAPDHRGRGYGSALTEQSARIFGQIGVWRVYRDTWEENQPMKAAFRRIGYREGKTREVRAPAVIR